MRDKERAVENPNVNCLEGRRCPQCGSFGPFEIRVSMRVLMFDSGSDHSKDCSLEYDEDAPAKCNNCNYAGEFARFNE
jgi:hypothetical protein